ncbi:type III secretion system effector protein SseE [Pseudomonas sp. MDT1-17]
MRSFSPADPVTDYLKQQGFTPEVAYFEASSFVMGWRVSFDDFTWVYRVEDGTLTVCDFTAVQDTQGKEGSRAVSQFVSLIQRIGRDVRGVQRVRGRFMEPLAPLVLKQTRERLANVLLAKGAQWRAIEGESWLVYSLGSNNRP